MVATKLEKVASHFLAWLDRLQIITTLISTWISGFSVCQAKEDIKEGEKGKERVTQGRNGKGGGLGKRNLSDLGLFSEQTSPEGLTPGKILQHEPYLFVTQE